MYALGQHLDRQCACRNAAQRRGRPQAPVVAAAGVESDDEIDPPESRREMVEISRQIIAARLLAGFDHSGATRMRNALRLQRADGGERSKDGVSVVGAAASVELAVIETRKPRTEPVEPPDHFRLLVEMSVEKHGRGICSLLDRRGHIEIE